jgi:hypothetical protein
MPLTLLQNVCFGRRRSDITGSTGVGYTLLSTAGAVVSPRTTTGVYHIASGTYAANVVFPDRFNGQILWDCPAVGSLPSTIAIEAQNVEANDPRVSDTWSMVNATTGSIQALYDISYGRWRILNNQMVFYKADNTTVVATFDLKDNLGNPTMDGVFERSVV